MRMLQEPAQLRGHLCYVCVFRRLLRAHCRKRNPMWFGANACTCTHFPCRRRREEPRAHVHCADRSFAHPIRWEGKSENPITSSQVSKVVISSQTYSQVKNHLDDRCNPIFCVCTWFLYNLHLQLLTFSRLDSSSECVLSSCKCVSVLNWDIFSEKRNVTRSMLSLLQ